MSKPQLWTANFISIAIANFLAFTSFYYLLVTLPVFAIQDMHEDEAAVGLITTVFLISAIVVRPMAGKWIERTGKTVVLLIAFAILCGASAFYFFAYSMPALLVLRFCHGIGFGMATTAAGAIVADLIPESRKGEGMGYYGLTMNLAMVVGPFLGLTVMQQGGATLMFIVNAAFCVLAFIGGLLVRLPKKEASQVVGVKDASSSGLRGFIEYSAIPVSLVAAFFALAYSAIISFVSVYAREIGVTEAASYFFVVYAVVLFVSRPFTGRWFDAYGAHVIIYPAILLFAVGTYLLSVSASAPLFLLSAALIGLGWGTVFPSLQTIAIQRAGPEKGAAATATYLSIFDFGFGVGSMLFPFIAVSIGYGTLYFYTSFLVLVGLAVYYALYGRSSARADETQ
ncbi:MFS transporter [Cohnella pontilimi]|uniref:MFS transporter n=1 Tax=Cohnella pontilimi TaxID=2564100 RepID=A0A4U0FDL0_9BACL|nr:MFS transporter [Cohnella pontilimi]TJY42861.1 MFS transporter [Cohnella pontilimi]